MPSSFDSFSDGDVIHALHVSEMHAPIQNLERGKSFYAEATGGPSAYAVSLSPSPDSPYQSGMIVNFKVNVQNTAGSPDVTLNVNSVSAKPIVKNGGMSLVAGDLKADQIVSVIYDEEEEQFNLLSVSSVNGLDDLSDVAITSPSNGQVLRHNGTSFVNSNLTAGDMPNGIDATKIGAGGVSDVEFSYLDGVTSSVQTQLNAKAAASHTHAAADITSGQLGVNRGGTGSDLSSTGGVGQVLKQSSTGGVVTVGVLSAGDMPAGIDAAKIGGGIVTNTEFSYLDGVTGSLQTQIDSKAAGAHNHAASDITSGQISLARGGTGSDLSSSGGAGQVLKQSTSGGGVTVSSLAASEMPNGIDASKVGDGSVSNVEFGYLGGVTSDVQSQLNGKAAVSHSHSASEITSGQVALARGGTASDLSATGGMGQVLKQASAGGSITVGALSASEMPSGIDASKVGDGSVSNVEFGYLGGVTSDVQSQLNGKAAVSHSHSASEITFGQVALARGGTASDLSATGGTGQVLKQVSAGGSITVGALSASEMPSGIDAAKIGSGGVSNTEFGYLDGVTSPLQSQFNLTSKGQFIYGNGSDGDVTISVDTDLTSHKFYNNLTVNSGVKLRTNGFEVYVRRTLTNNGTIQNNGGNGTHSSANVPQSPGVAAGWSYGSVLSWVGETGATAPFPSVGTYAIGGNSTGYNPLALYSAAGGSGGYGYSLQYSSYAYGGGGWGNVYSSRITPRMVLSGFPNWDDAPISGGSVLAYFRGGLGGGSGASGAGYGYSGAGGAGGGGGGVVFIAAFTLAGSGAIQARGGSGANAGDSGSTAAQSGGGGGGGGGLVLLLSNSVSNPYTVDAYGGSGGWGANGGGSGSSGSNGQTYFQGGLS